MSGNKALKRALQTKDAVRLTGNIPLIQDTTEMITPGVAQEMLRHNKSNRPINWRKVQEYADIMSRGEWRFHAQGIIFDQNGNLLTGQKRLWAVIYSGMSIPMRVSRGNPANTANLLDRGTPQSARDLATRKTERKHSPTEASIARAILVLGGNLKPSIDQLGAEISDNATLAEVILRETTGTRKSKSVIMVMAAICAACQASEQAQRLAKRVEFFAKTLDKSLEPETAERCWGKGAAFSLALESARKIIAEAKI